MREDCRIFKGHNNKQNKDGKAEKLKDAEYIQVKKEEKRYKKECLRGQGVVREGIKDNNTS